MDVVRDYFFDTPTAKARGILGLTTAFYANGLHSDARHFNRLLKRDFPCAPRYGVRSLHGLVFAAPDRDSDATGFTHPALRGWNPIPVLSRTSGIAVPNGHFTTPQPPTMLCAPSEHVGESMYPRAKAAGFYSSPTPPLFYKGVLIRNVPMVWDVADERFYMNLDVVQHLTELIGEGRNIVRDTYTKDKASVVVKDFGKATDWVILVDVRLLEDKQ